MLVHLHEIKTAKVVNQIQSTNCHVESMLCAHLQTIFYRITELDNKGHLWIVGRNQGAREHTNLHRKKPKRSCCEVTVLMNALQELKTVQLSVHSSGRQPVDRDNNRKNK